MKRIAIIFSLLILLGTASADEFSPEIIRISGKNRYETAVGVSSFTYEKSDNIIIASGNSFPDALSGSALASTLDAPILLTDRDSLSSQTIDAISSLEPKRIIILGSRGSVSENVEKQLRPIARTRRIGGKDRYETSVLISKLVQDINGNTEIGLASGANFPDALAASSYVDQRNIPLLLTDPNKFPKDVEAFINGNPINKITVFGGENAISSSSLQGYDNVGRIAGDDRYDTAVKIAQASYDELDTIVLVNGGNFPDALASSAIMHKYKAPILLVAKDEIPEKVKEYILDKSPDRIIIVGGNNSVSSKIVSDLWKLSNPVEEKDKPNLVSNSFNEDYAKDLADLINRERQGMGSSILDYDQSLVNAAKTRAVELSEKFSYSTRPDGTDWSTVSPNARAQFAVVLNGFTEDVLNNLKVVANIYVDRDDIDAMGTAVWTDENGRTYWLVIFGAKQ